MVVKKILQEIAKQNGVSTNMEEWYGKNDR